MTHAGNRANDPAFADYVRKAIAGVRLNIEVDGTEYLLTAVPYEQVERAQAAERVKQAEVRELVTAMTTGLHRLADRVQAPAPAPQVMEPEVYRARLEAVARSLFFSGHNPMVPVSSTAQVEQAWDKHRTFYHYEGHDP